MALRAYKPTTPAQRGMTTQDFSMVTTNKPVRSLITARKRASGRNNQGRITTRHKGAGVYSFYRNVSFGLPDDVTAKVEHIEYDPNRSARIARLKDEKGNYYYILAAAKLKVGRKITVGKDAPILTANRLPLTSIPNGSFIHSIELQPGKGGQLVRSAGTWAQLMSKEDKYAQVRLPSGEVRLINVNAQASIGQLGNEQHQNVKIGKAGRTRRKGIRPTVRGVVMNAVDHPHGGGDGGRHGTAKDPRTPWGQKTLGYKTRKRKLTNKYIIKTRHEAKRT